MKTLIKYIEHKTAEHTDQASAWIARVWPSASGRTLYFNDMALKRCSGFDSNHFDLVSGEEYWVSGVKKRGSNRYGGGGSIYIEKSNMICDIFGIDRRDSVAPFGAWDCEGNRIPGT